MAIGIKDFYAGKDVECSRVSAFSTAYPKHTHEEYIISANIKGVEKVWVDKKNYLVPAGHVTVYNPMAIQSSEFFDVGAEFISLHVNPDSIRRIIRENNIASRDSYPALIQGAFRNDALFKAIQGCYLAAVSPTDHKEESLNLYRKLDLSTLASSVGLSKYHFVRTFRQEVGMAPLQYHMQLRLIEARRMIRAGAKPIDAMVDLGFYDQSHFIKTFRKVMAITPDLYSRTLSKMLS
ncbi:MAG: AraC family transcriptional regulator [Pseudidiomarina maritima]|nr:AraC family transcriptional regulator [Pseudidiomarina maritima]